GVGRREGISHGPRPGVVLGEEAADPERAERPRPPLARLPGEARQRRERPRRLRPREEPRGPLEGRPSGVLLLRGQRGDDGVGGDGEASGVAREPRPSRLAHSPHRSRVTVRVATAPPAVTRTTYTPAGSRPASRVSPWRPAGYSPDAMVATRRPSTS